MALEATLTENGLVKIASGTALAMRAGASRDVVEVRRILAHPSEDITIKTAEMMGIETTGQWGACETCFQVKAKRHAVEWESDSGATFHMSRTRAGMSAYKKASPGTNVEIADGNILPVDGFGRIEVDLDQPGHTTKMVKMDDVAYVPGLSRNLLSTVKAVEQLGKPLIYYRNKAVLGFPGE